MNNPPAESPVVAPDVTNVEPLYHGLRLFFGVGFILAGLGLYYVILTQLRGILGGTTSYPMLDKFVSPEARTLQIPMTGDRIALPPVFFTGMGYGVVTFMFSIVVSIGNNLVRNGVGLIQPDARALIRRLRNELGKKSGK